MPIKKEFRNKLRQMLAAVSPEERHDRSLAATKLLVSEREFVKAQVIMLFLSTPQEIDTNLIAFRGWADHKRVLVPKVSWEQRRMIPIEIRSLDTDVRVGGMGIREPADGMPFPVGDIDLIIVPGLGFDARGNRLGRGRGFYDRFLTHPDLHATICGLALEQQFVGTVPHDETDVRMNMLVTDEKVRRFKTRT